MERTELIFKTNPEKPASVMLNKERFAQSLRECIAEDNLSSIKGKIYSLKNTITFRGSDREYILNIDSNGDAISFRKDILISELDQILKAKTTERAKYYLNRLNKFHIK
jgi:hypothetical protein